MGSCKIIKPGLLSTIQDSGRKGLRYYALPASGYLDTEAAHLAHMLVGNKKESALIECNYIGPTIEFNSQAYLALTGADMQWAINKEPIQLNTTHAINPGDVLSSKIALDGIRAYIAINGTLSGNRHFGSASTYLPAGLGCNNGTALQKGEIIMWDEHSEKPALISIKKENKQSELIRIKRGPEYTLLTEKSKTALIEAHYLVTTDSNRMGARLDGEELETTRSLQASVATLPGFIQLPPSGKPIVVLQDGQTTGGYPRIAYIPEEELSLFNQLAFRKPFRFQLIN